MNETNTNDYQQLFELWEQITPEEEAAAKAAEDAAENEPFEEYGRSTETQR
jgi:hypothetical protein